MNILLRHIVLPIRDFIYPPVCFTCGEYLRNGEERVCASCWNSFTDVHPTSPTWIELKGKFCAEGVVDDVVSRYLFEEEGKLQKVVHLLKYQEMKSLGVRLGRDVGWRIQQYPNFQRADCVVPVPLHKLKRRERGYNQSEYVCKGISEVTNIPIDASLIVRTKYTQSQTQLNLKERMENVGDAFAINPKCASSIEGQTIILVDDVITTGSTINACARELRAHGVVRVLAASVALAQ